MTVLSPKGIPTPLAATRLVPPDSRMAPLTPDEIAAIVGAVDARRPLQPGRRPGERPRDHHRAAREREGRRGDRGGRGRDARRRRPDDGGRPRDDDPRPAAARDQPPREGAGGRASVPRSASARPRRRRPATPRSSASRRSRPASARPARSSTSRAGQSLICAACSTCSSAAARAARRPAMSTDPSPFAAAHPHRRGVRGLRPQRRAHQRRDRPQGRAGRDRPGRPPLRRRGPGTSRSSPSSGPTCRCSR